MKFQFKIQEYQTEAVEAVVKAFEGQPYYDRVSYLRDLGKKDSKMQTTFLGAGTDLLSDNADGFENAPIELADEQLLDNIRTRYRDGNGNRQDLLLYKNDFRT